MTWQCHFLQTGYRASNVIVVRCCTAFETGDDDPRERLMLAACKVASRRNQNKDGDRRSMKFSGICVSRDIEHQIKDWNRRSRKPLEQKEVSKS